MINPNDLQQEMNEMKWERPTLEEQKFHAREERRRFWRHIYYSFTCNLDWFFKIVGILAFMAFLTGRLHAQSSGPVTSCLSFPGTQTAGVTVFSGSLYQYNVVSVVYDSVGAFGQHYQAPLTSSWFILSYTANGSGIEIPQDEWALKCNAGLLSNQNAFRMFQYYQRGQYFQIGVTGALGGTLLVYVSR